MASPGPQRRAIVLAEDSYQELELWYPLLRLREAGVDTQVVGPAAATYTSKYGYPVQADLAAADAVATPWDAVVIPGGYAPDRMRRHPEMVRLVRDAAQRGSIVAAICHAGWMLGSADILRGRRVTSFSAIRDDLVHAGAQWVDEPCVVDGNLITSRKPEDLPAFCRALLGALGAAR